VGLDFLSRARCASERANAQRASDAGSMAFVNEPTEIIESQSERGQRRFQISRVIRVIIATFVFALALLMIFEWYLFFNPMLGMSEGATLLPWPS
jgi:hypothetical protein